MEYDNNGNIPVPLTSSKYTREMHAGTLYGAQNSLLYDT